MLHYVTRNLRPAGVNIPGRTPKVVRGFSFFGASFVYVVLEDGTGSEVMRRIAVPMVDGMVSSTVLTLIVIPAIYALVKEWTMMRKEARVP